MFVDCFTMNPLVDLKIVEQVVNATEIGTLKEIIIGKVTEVPTIANSETVIKNFFPRKTYFFLEHFWFSFPRLKIYIG
jgi:hypothetical protein